MELIKTIDEIQEYVPVAATSQITTLRPYIRLATRNYLETVLGSAFLVELAGIYTAAVYNVATIQDSKTKEVITLVQESISNLAIMHALPILSVSIGASGINVISNDQTAPAAQWRTNQVFESLAEVGHKTIDRLLAYLEAEKAQFTTWANDPIYQAFQTYFIRTANEFNALYNISESRYLFYCIRYCMARVENFDIKKSIGQKLFDKIKTDDRAGTLAGNFKVLLYEYLKPAISLFTVAKALQERLITLSSGRVSINFSGSSDNMNQSKSPERLELEQSILSLQADAKQWISDAQDFIIANPDQFAVFESAASTKKRMNFKNDQTKGTFIF